MLRRLRRCLSGESMQPENAHYKVCAIYDTETCNYKDEATGKWLAYLVLFIVNDLRNVDLTTYVYDRSDNVIFYRHENEFVSFVNGLVRWGIAHKVIPVIAAYNLMFDLQPVLELLAETYDMEVNAQSSTNVYTLDLCLDGNNVLRFWDAFHLDMRGLAAMGAVCGLPKATGSWDYDLVRTPETPLTDDELHYATRDVQVIPAYLRYLLDANEWLEPAMFGFRIITKTSIVRQMAKKKIYPLKYRKANGKRSSIGFSYDRMCERQAPSSFDIYALRKTCFRGGYTFTSANNASRVVENVASLDVTSMHHAFINGRYLPCDFKKFKPSLLQQIANEIVHYSIDEVLARYDKPFWHGLHVRVRFDNVRIKAGSAFDAWQIALCPMSKFRLFSDDDFSDSESKRFAETHVKLSGWHDNALNPTFAFGKLYAAKELTVHVTELELWCLSRVYEWDNMRVILGEATAHFSKAPDYVTAQSHYLYELKNEMKDVCKRYTGEPLDCSAYAKIDKPIVEGLQKGSFTTDFVRSYYQSTVKGMFNAIYGVQAQDIYKPVYTVEKGHIHVDDESAVCAWNFEDKAKDNTGKVLYTFGMRIVGGSRMHLIIAIELLYEKFGKRVTVLAGDTDSLKVRCDRDITNDDLMQALQPLHEAVKLAIDAASERLRRTQPNCSSSLKNVGCFEIEKCGNSDRYVYHMEAWNKARVSIDTDNKAHVTCAGLSRPADAYTIESFIEDLLKLHDPAQVLPAVLGYNVHIPFEIAHALEHTQPDISDVMDMTITDYLGHTAHVTAHRSIALYPSGRMIGDTTKRVNAYNLKYVSVDDSLKWLNPPADGIPARISYLDGSDVL